MKILVINGSPHGMNGFTATLIKPFIKGMKDAGGKVEIINLGQQQIHFCRGCVACWFSTPGECVQKDDMEKNLQQLRKSDLWIFMTPLYVDGVSGQLKTFMDRTVPLLSPFAEIHDGQCRHPLREGCTPGKLLLFSSCAWFQNLNFDSTISHIRAYCHNAHREYMGAILRPHSSTLNMINLKDTTIINDLEQAGVELVREQKLNKELIKNISQPLLPMEDYVSRFNEMMQNQLDHLVKK